MLNAGEHGAADTAQNEAHSPPETNLRLRILLIAMLATALATGLASLLRVLSPRPAWELLTPVAFLIALESTLTTRWLAHPDRRHLNHVAYRLSELIVIGLALRLLTWTITGNWPNLVALRGYVLAPLTFLDLNFLGYLLCAFVAWERAIRFSTLFSELELSRGELAFYSLSRSEQDKRAHERPPNPQRTYAFNELTKSWLLGGFVLGLLAATTTVNLPALNLSTIRTVGRLGLRPEMLWALIIYFVLGLWLLSQARLSMIRARWLVNGVPARRGVFAAWRRSSLLLLFVVALVAAFLPIGSTFAASAILQTVLSVVAAVIEGIIVLAALILLLFASLFGFPQAQEEIPPLAPATPPLPELPNVAPPSETAALLAGSAFWLIVATVATIGVFFFLRDRGYMPSLQSLMGWWQDVLAWLRDWTHGVSDRTLTLRDAVRRRLTFVRGSRQASGAPWRFLRINSLPPRQQIRYFYLSTVRRAGEQGTPRGESETPSEYSQALQEDWPDASEEIEALTGAFLQARYSRRELESDDVNPVKRVWKRVRASLRHGGRRREE